MPMTQRLFKFGHRTIGIIFNFFIFVTLLFAITSPNLILGDNDKTGSGTTLVTSWLLIIVVAFVLCTATFPSFRHRLKVIFIDHKLVTASVICALVIGWQVLFVAMVHPPIGFDPGAIHEALYNTSDPELRAYYSEYYNNLLLVLIQHGLATTFHTTSWLFMDYCTLIMADLAALFNIFGVWLLDKRKLAPAMYIQAAAYSVFPMIIVPYTDVWVLPFVSGYLLGYLLMTNPRCKTWVRVVATIFFAVMAIGAYFMKPSAIIGVIAIVIIEALFKLKQAQSVKQLLKLPRLSLILGLLWLVVAGATYEAGNRVVLQQTYIPVTQGRTMPAIHFVSMGVSGEGGYNAHDALVMGQLATKEERSAYSKKLLIKRLKKMGAFGYLQFLVKKQRNNTADGTFAWVKEGHFINLDPTPTVTTGLAGNLNQFVYLYGTRLGDFRFIAQAWWVIWLALIAFGWSDKRKFVLILRTMVIGGMLYLLIFEGGRSRYLIQFLPAFFMLAALVYDRGFAFVARVYRWGTGQLMHQSKTETGDNDATSH